CAAVAAILSMPFGLSARSYYRVHKGEFDKIAAYLGEHKNFFTFLIASPENEVAMSSAAFDSPKANMSSIAVSFSDDFEIASLEETDGEVDYTFVLKSVNSDQSQYTVNIFDKSTGSTLAGVLESNYRFVFDNVSSSAYSKDFRIIYDAPDAGNIQLRSALRDSDNKYQSVEYAETGSGVKVFKLLPNDYSAMGIYRLDLFEWTVDDSEYENNGEIVLTSVPNDNLTGQDGISVHYILNEGEDVSLEELIDAPDKVEVPRFREGEKISVSIPVSPSGVSRTVADGNTTLWALPVRYMTADETGSEDVTVPLGKVISKEYSDGGLTVGIKAVEKDRDTDVPVYYTIDGRVAAHPLLPGVYVKRVGDKVSKIIVR
ncbi:MAG: hypothetical protein K2G05_06530, partial [Duncaniella sp.]|nr:hypothetical protein [Duncaniella sp.]